MQTFLPFEDFEKSAKSLHRLHLGKQRLECKQILSAMHFGGGWSHHPAVRMWRGYTGYLIRYYSVIVAEWVRRGYRHTMVIDKFYYEKAVIENSKPPWLGNYYFHIAHRNLLVFKNREHYTKVLDDFIYIERPHNPQPINKDGSLNSLYKED